VKELFSLVTSQTYPCDDETKKTFYRNYFWRLNLMKQTHLTVTKTLTPTKDMMKTGAASRSQVHIWPRLQGIWNSGGVHPFVGVPSGSRIQGAPHVNKASMPITVFFLFFIQLIQMFKYYSQYLDMPDNNGRWS
jgi:hypothetical protein